MSDLAATHCGNTCEGGCFGGNNSCIWIILILLFCNGGFGSNSLFNFGGGEGCGCGCDFIIPLILILSCCGGCN